MKLLDWFIAWCAIGCLIVLAFWLAGIAAHIYGTIFMAGWHFVD